MKVGRSGVIARKVGMTSLFTDAGKVFPVTLFSLEDCCVVARREDCGFVSLQVGSGRSKKPSKPLRGHFVKAGVEPKAILREFRVLPEFALPVGTRFCADYFTVHECVDVTGVTIGRGFAGSMKRHNFHGLRATHGVSVSHRSHGSTGNRKDPGKVFKGKKMAGHMGCCQVTVQNLSVLEVDVERGLLVIKGAVPGFQGGWVMIQDAVKKSCSLKKMEDGVILGERNVASTGESVVMEEGA